MADLSAQLEAKATNMTGTDEERPDSKPGTVTLPLSRGKSAIIDRTDYNTAAPFKWHVVAHADGRMYAGCRRVINGRRQIIYLHRLLLNAPTGMDVDHVNGDGLDNRRSNLRLASRQHNIANRGKMRRATSSRFVGVYFSEELQKWRAHIKILDRHIHLGCFADEVEAAKAYDRAAAQHWGEFAKPNLPSE